jgi:hypothetical protein
MRLANKWGNETMHVYALGQYMHGGCGLTVEHDWMGVVN